MDKNPKKEYWIHCPICGAKTRTRIPSCTVPAKKTLPMACKMLEKIVYY